MNQIPYCILRSAYYHPLLIAIKKATPAPTAGNCAQATRGRARGKYPYIYICIYIYIPALAAGNCVVLKPPEAAPVVSFYICIIHI